MGSYYSGMMNNTGGYGELRHFGILGQKWGIRRFQNPDGTLTEAGKERYGSGAEQRNLAKMLLATPRDVDKIESMPQVKDAAMKLKSLGEQSAKADKALEDHTEKVYEALYDNPQTYEKWLNICVDRFMKDNNPDEKYGSREDIYNWYKYDDGDQNERGTFETFTRESKDPVASKYRELEKESILRSRKLNDASKELAKDILGESTGDTDGRGISAEFWMTYLLSDASKKQSISDGTNNRDVSFGSVSGHKSSNKSGNDISNPHSAPTEKEYKRYLRLQGTKSLLGGDHTKDESVKVLKDYHNEIYAARKKLRNEASNNGKDSYKESVKNISAKYADKYAEGILKDMGYTVNQSTVAWIKQQPWFYMRGADDIVF